MVFAFNGIGKLWVCSWKKQNRGGERREVDGEEKRGQCVVGKTGKIKKKK
jgi:hypothetical protein